MRVVYSLFAFDSFEKPFFHATLGWAWSDDGDRIGNIHGYFWVYTFKHISNHWAFDLKATQGFCFTDELEDFRVVKIDLLF